MEIKLHNIQKFVGGGGFGNYWYSGLQDYDPLKYTMNLTYDTSKLVNANNFKEPWSSYRPSIGIRYQPTSGYGAYGIGGQHFNFTKGVEDSPEYRRFGENLIKNGKFTPLGEAWAKATDALLPSDSESRFFDKNNNLRTSWSPNIPDAHGRLARTFTNLEDYVNWVRNDLILGARHNIFLPSLKGVGYRYYYKDAAGVKHWVSPEDAVRFTKKNTPNFSIDGKGGTWIDFELTGEEALPLRFNLQLQEVVTTPELEEGSAGESGRQKVLTEEGGYGFDWNKVKEGAQKLFNNPELYALGRLAGNLINNERVYGHALKAIKPNLTSSYHTYRQVVGDEATKLAYYRRAAEGVTKASRPMTSDADRQMAYQMEAQRAANELRAQGDLADNQMIQKTSDESNLHQWANTQRDNLVANANRAAMNDANARKLNLLALRDSAQWTSVDNYLLGIEYRKRLQLAEQQQLNDLIWQLLILELMYEEPDLVNARAKLQLARKNHTDSTGMVDVNDPEVVDALKEYNLAYNRFMVKMYKQRYQKRNNTIDFDKKGSKITWKRKDDLLYKSAKDIVEHFRKMTKLAYDSVSKRPKEIKLVSHPKGSTKKYLLGGVAPFTVYKPVALGGETTTVSEGSTSSIKKSSSDDLGQDLLKDLFKLLLANGLPSDVNAIYSKIGNLLLQQEFFGNALSTDDILSIYVSTMQLINTIKFNKALYDKAQELVINRDAGDEVALTADGKVVVLNRDTAELDFKKIDEVDRKKESVLTNNDLLNIRAYSPSAALNSSLLTITNNATSLNEISKYLKAQLPSIGSSERTIEGYSLKDSNDIKLGIELLAGAPNGLYKISEYSKSLKDLANKALQYLYTILPNNMKNLLAIHTGGQLEALDLIATMINSTLDFNERTNVLAITGKASDKSGSGSNDGLEINSAVLLLSGMSSPREFTFSTGNGNSFTGFARISSINDVNESPFGADFSYSKIYESTVRKNLDLDNACFGDVPINKALKDRIIVDNSTIAGVDLPYIVDSNGRIIPDFKMFDRIQEADKEIMREGINPEENPQAANAIYVKHQLPIKYGENNQLTNNYKRFAVILATAIEDVFLDKSGLSSNGTLTLVSDEEEIDKYVEDVKRITGKKDIDLDKPGIFNLGNKDIYKGSIFIPIIGDLTDAISASKTGKLTENNYDDYRNKWNTRNYVKAPQFVKQ